MLVQNKYFSTCYNTHHFYTQIKLIPNIEDDMSRDGSSRSRFWILGACMFHLVAWLLLSCMRDGERKILISHCTRRYVVGWDGLHFDYNENHLYHDLRYHTGNFMTNI